MHPPMTCTLVQRSVARPPPQPCQYLTEIDDRGRRSGFFYLDPQEAATTYKDVKAVDPNAALSVVSMDSIWFRLPRRYAANLTCAVTMTSLTNQTPASSL